jgi:uncharacterized protein
MEQLTGFAFPFQIESLGHGVALSEGKKKIKENIIQIILTGIGERVMRHDYGAGIRELVHDPNNDVLRSIVQHQIAKSIGKWEPRVMLQEVNVTQQEGTLIAELQYTVRATHVNEYQAVPIHTNEA